MENEQKTQLEKVNDELIALVPNVASSDRAAAKKKYSAFTIVQYLKGRGKDLDTAMALLQFFRKRIEDREKAIA